MHAALALLVTLVWNVPQEPLSAQPGAYGTLSQAGKEVDQAYFLAVKEGNQRWGELDVVVLRNETSLGKTGHYRIDALMCQRLFFTHDDEKFGATRFQTMLEFVQKGKTCAENGSWPEMAAWMDAVELTHKLKHLAPTEEELLSIPDRLARFAAAADPKGPPFTPKMGELLFSLGMFSTTRTIAGEVNKVQLSTLLKVWNKVITFFDARHDDEPFLFAVFCDSTTFAVLQLDEKLCRRSVTVAQKYVIPDQYLSRSAMMAAACASTMPDVSRQLLAEVATRAGKLNESDRAFTLGWAAIAKSYLKLMEPDYEGGIAILDAFVKSPDYRNLVGPTKETLTAVRMILQTRIQPPPQANALRATTLLTLTGAISKKEYTAAVRAADEILSELDPSDPYFATALDMRIEAKFQLKANPKDLVADVRRCREAYLAFWERRFVPQTPSGILQGLQANPLTRFGAILIDAGEVEEGLATVEAGRGWGALGAIVRSENKKEAFAALARLPEVGGLKQSTNSKLKTICLSYLLVPERDPMVISVADGQIKAIKLKASYETILKTSQKWIDAIKSSPVKGDATEKKLAQELYKILIQPVAAAIDLKETKRFRVVADGPLNSIPFAALCSSTGSRLVDSYRMVMSPTLRSFGTSTPNTKIRYGFVVPELNGLKEFSPLNELRLVAGRTAEELKANTIKGNKISPSQVEGQLAAWNVANFVTHGVLSPLRDLDSYLVLGGNPTRPERLSARQIAGMNLKLDLACLWACNTASGQVQGGDGNISLAWAFLAAGCKSTLATKWEVEQRAASTLLSSFLHRMSDNQEDQEQAFFRAVRELKQQRPEPFYWAPFEYTSVL